VSCDSHLEELHVCRFYARLNFLQICYGAAVAPVVLERHHRKVFTRFHEGQRVNTTALFG